MADNVPALRPDGDPERSRELRASHEDRDQVVEVLRTAAGDGRITAEELDERIEAALTARTYSELAVLTTDLPAVPGVRTAVPAGPPPEAKEVVRLECRSGDIKRNGPWVVPQRIQVRVTSGNVLLDFTDAVITQPTLQIDAEVSSGSLTLVTKPGIAVDADNVAVRSGNVSVKEPWGSSVPVRFRVEVSGKVGSGSMRARPPRRTFWQWLMRGPRPYAITAS
ncbi:MAG TPA: DUF1707 domain-containing protein [Streptosporangiaceae bacterium]|jgi:hypothetical protein